MPKIDGRTAIKPYNIAVNEADNSAEINMYGEVVERHPIDVWTGKPVDGEFIVIGDFLRDIDDLKERNKITVHINSVGGDLYAGIAIYNRLKTLPANVTTINDGLAASAGSIILQAGDTRQVHAGSNIMVHQAMAGLMGYYQTKDLKEIIKQLDAGNKAAVNIYAEASGRDPDAIKAMVDKETWLTGQEAVDAGLADEVIDNGMPVSMSLSADKSTMMVNGMAMSTRGMSNIPARIPVITEKNIVSPAAPAPVDDKTKNERSNLMEIKNIEELRAAYPDLMAQAEAAAREEGRDAGAMDERARIQGIESIQAAIADQEMIVGAKYGENPMTAEQLAYQAMQVNAALGASMLKNIVEDGKESGTDNVAAGPNGGPEVQEEHAESAEHLANEAVKIYNKIMNGGKNNGK